MNARTSKALRNERLSKVRCQRAQGIYYNRRFDNMHNMAVFTLHWLSNMKMADKRR